MCTWQHVYMSILYALHCTLCIVYQLHHFDWQFVDCASRTDCGISFHHPQIRCLEGIKDKAFHPYYKSKQVGLLNVLIVSCIHYTMYWLYHVFHSCGSVSWWMVSVGKCLILTGMSWQIIYDFEYHLGREWYWDTSLLWNAQIGHSVDTCLPSILTIHVYHPFLRSILTIHSYRPCVPSMCTDPVSWQHS